MRCGRCTNVLDNCPLALSGEVVSVVDGADLRCPECGREMMPRVCKGEEENWRRAAAIAGLVLAIAAVALWAWTRPPEVPPAPPPPVADEHPTDGQAPPEDSLKASLDSLLAASAWALAAAQDQDAAPQPDPEGAPLARATDERADADLERQRLALERERIALERERSATSEAPRPSPASQTGPQPSARCADLTRRITELTVRTCPGHVDETRRTACYAEIERLNSELNACDG